MSLSLIALVVLAQSATITYEPNPPEEAPPASETVEAPAAESPAEEAFLPPTESAYIAPAPAQAVESSVTSGVDHQKAARGRSLFRGALELAAHTLPSGTPGGLQDLYVNVTPILAVDTGDAFGFELGGVLRLRAFDDSPAQRDTDYGGVLRGADWDERSDFGQVLRELWLGNEEWPVRLRAGPLRRVSLGRGLLVNRYSNQLNPDYHPAGGVVTVEAGPIHAQALASDVLAARLFALQATADIGEWIGAVEQRGRYHVGLSAGHDFGQAGGASPAITLLLLEGDAALYQGEAARLFAYGAVGSRLLTPDFAMGAALGLSADGNVGGTVLGGKLEGRKIGGGFRFGMFGPSYELGRFSDIGFTQTGVADARLPDGFSGYAEMQVELGNPGDLDLSHQGAVMISAAAEYFSWGRLDLDATVTGRLPRDVGTLTGRVSVAGLNELPRYQGSGEFRYRFAPSFYALAHGGVVFFPQPDSTLTRGFFAGVGVGADFSH